jgi:hypothetical protein
VEVVASFHATEPVDFAAIDDGETEGSPAKRSKTSAILSSGSVSAISCDQSPDLYSINSENALAVVFPLIEQLPCESSATYSSMPDKHTSEARDTFLYGVHTVISDLHKLGCPIHLIPRIPMDPDIVIPKPKGNSASHLSGFLYCDDSSSSPSSPSSSSSSHICLSSGSAWIDNHYRWVVWKLASLERHASMMKSSAESQWSTSSSSSTSASVFSSPAFSDGSTNISLSSSLPHHQHRSFTYLSYPRIVAELAHRIRRELELCQRSCLKLVLERDAASSMQMVLCVASITKLPQSSTSSASGNCDFEMQL